MCLDRQDYVRAQILARKISPRVFEAEPSKVKKPKEGESIVEEAPADIPSLLELKRIYYQLMIRYIPFCLSFSLSICASHTVCVILLHDKCCDELCINEIMELPCTDVHVHVSITLMGEYK